MISKKDIIWGYVSQFLNVGSGIILIPIALKYLSSDDLGLWYLFLAIIGLVQLLEFGFQPTISRMTSYVCSGATELLSEGIPTKSDKINYQLFYDLMCAARKIYQLIALAALVVLMFFGTLYLETFPSFKQEQQLAWVIFVISNIVNFYFTYYNGLIIGRGDQQDIYKVTTYSKLIMLTTSITLLFFGFGLNSMAIGMLISTLFTRYLLYVKFYNFFYSNGIEIKKYKILTDYKKVLWLASYKLGITSLGSFLILRSNMFLVSSFLGLKLAASYGLTIQLIGILSNVSSMIFNLKLPSFNRLQNRDDKKDLKKHVVSSIILSDVLYILGAMFILFVGVDLLSLISSKTVLVEFHLLFLMLLVYLLEMNHALCATYLTTLNKVPFVYSSLISGFFIVICGLLVANFTNYGLIGLIVSQGCIQLIYNNWYWPLSAYRDLNYGK